MKCALAKTVWHLELELGLPADAAAPVALKLRRKQSNGSPPRASDSSCGESANGHVSLVQLCTLAEFSDLDRLLRVLGEDNDAVILGRLIVLVARDHLDLASILPASLSPFRNLVSMIMI